MSSNHIVRVSSCAVQKHHGTYNKLSDSKLFSQIPLTSKTNYFGHSEVGMTASVEEHKQRNTQMVKCER